MLQPEQPKQDNDSEHRPYCQALQYPPCHFSFRHIQESTLQYRVRSESCQEKVGGSYARRRAIAAVIAISTQETRGTTRKAKAGFGRGGPKAMAL